MRYFPRSDYRRRQLSDATVTVHSTRSETEGTHPAEKLDSCRYLRRSKEDSSCQVGQRLPSAAEGRNARLLRQLAIASGYCGEDEVGSRPSHDIGGTFASHWARLQSTVQGPTVFMLQQLSSLEKMPYGETGTAQITPRPQKSGGATPKRSEWRYPKV